MNLKPEQTVAERTSWELIAQYLAGACSDTEAHQVRRWAAANEDRRTLLAVLEEVWAAADDSSDPGERPESWDLEPAWARFHERIQQEAASQRSPVLRLEPAQRGGAARRRVMRILRVAASVVLLVGAGTAASLAYLRFDASRNAPQLFTTAPGQRATLKLADGTDVLLGPDTRFTAPPGFRGRRREVGLEGSAYFDVASEPERPFVVHAGGSETRVLGTEFGIRAYGSDDAVQVVVSEGRVRFSGAASPPEQAVTLTPGQRGTLARGQTAPVADEVDVRRALAWTEGQLVFEKTPLSDVVEELRRWFGVEFRVADPSIMELRLTGTFETESVRDIVEIIAASLEVRYSRSADVISFHPVTNP